jgi:ribosome maturation factor RimP
MNTESIKKEIKKPLEENNIELLDVKFVVEHENNYLRVTIDTINLEDCVKATKIINPIIDKMNLMDDHYFLEVYSKGEVEDEQ